MVLHPCLQITGRLRALPPPAAASTPVQPPTTSPCPTATDPGGELPATALAERVGDFNQSMDPWERTGAAPELRFALTHVGTAGASLVMLQQFTMTTLVIIASRGSCFQNESRRGSSRTCPFVTLGARPAPPNDAAPVVLTLVIFA